MLPVLLDLKFIKIYTFGVFLVLSFFWGSFLLWKNIRLTSHKEEDVFDSLFISLGSALFFGRLFYVILNFNKFGLDLLKFILINGYPGLSLYGTLFGGLAALYLYSLSKKTKLIEVIDYYVGPIFIALAFGKLGSFFSGVEVGAKTKFLLAIKFVGFDGSRHLTPFYESLLFFLGIYLGQRLLFQIRREKYPHGYSFYFFAWYFSLIYFLFDKLKFGHLYFLNQSFNWMISLLILLTFSFYFLYYFRSLIFSGISKIGNYFTNYGQKTFQKIYRRPRKKVTAGEK